MTQIIYSDIRPKARPVLSLEVPETQQDGLLKVNLMDMHCVTPDCPCQAATLVIPSAVTVPSEVDWASRLSNFSVSIDCQTGELEPVRHRDPAGAWLEEALKAKIDSKLLQKLNRRRTESKLWGLSNKWKFADWSHLKPGEMLSFQDVLPAAPGGGFSYQDQDYLWFDQYCCTAGCQCSEMVLAVCDRALPKPLGYARIDLPSQRILSIEGRTVPEIQLRALTEEMFQQDPGMMDLIRQRAAFMGGEFAQLVQEQRGARPSGKVGRNDPCPCGSGKKFKKCCLA